MAMFHRRSALRATLGLGAVLWMPRVRACEFQTGTLRVTHPYVHATAPGDDTAMLCMTLDEVTQADRLVRVSTPVAASASMGGLQARAVVDLPIAVGQEIVLHEGGTHVRLSGLKHALLPGRSYALVLGFEKSGEFNTSLSVDYERFR